MPLFVFWTEFTFLSVLKDAPLEWGIYLFFEGFKASLSVCYIQKKMEKMSQ